MSKKSNKPTAKIYMAQIWYGDNSLTRIFTCRAKAEEAISTAFEEAKAKGDYISDSAICEMALEGSEFINTYSKRPEF